METLQRYPIIPICLILLACIRFEYRTSSSGLSVPGLAGGLVALGIVALVLLHRIFKSFEKMCRAKRWLNVPLRHRYDILFPIAVVAAAIKWSYLGPEIIDLHGNRAPQWEIAWSDTTHDVYFVLVVLLVVGLLRVNDFIRAIEKSSNGVG